MSRCAWDREHRFWPGKRRLNILLHKENGFWANDNKVAVDSWARAEFYQYPSTTLKMCEVCGFSSTPKKVHYRSMIYGWNVDKTINGTWLDYSQESKTTLCMKCWNKIRPIVKAEEEANKNQLLINKLNREMGKWQKSQQQAN